MAPRANIDISNMSNNPMVSFALMEKKAFNRAKREDTGSNPLLMFFLFYDKLYVVKHHKGEI